MTKRIEMARLEWKPDPKTGEEVPRHRTTWTENGKRRERTIRLDWKGDPKKLMDLYWQCETGTHERQTGSKPEQTWQELVEEWRRDRRVQSKIKDSTRKSYRKTMEWILDKNADLPVKSLTFQKLRAVHDKYADTPRKADKFVQVVKLLWNFGENKLRWDLGLNPAKGLDLYGVQRPFEHWPDWMIDALKDAPENVQTAAYLILGRGERPSAAIAAQWSGFNGEWMSVKDEKTSHDFEIFCPPSLSQHLSTLQKRGAYVLAKNLTEPLGYDAIEKQFRRWRLTLGEKAKPYSLHGLRKLAIIQLAEAGCGDAEIQSITNQSAETVAYYRVKADRKRMSRNAQLRREQGTNKE